MGFFCVLWLLPLPKKKHAGGGGKGLGGWERLVSLNCPMCEWVRMCIMHRMLSISPLSRVSSCHEPTVLGIDSGSNTTPNKIKWLRMGMRILFTLDCSMLRN